jgi:hypothetical protein
MMMIALVASTDMDDIQQAKPGRVKRSPVHNLWLNGG